MQESRHDAAHDQEIDASDDYCFEDEPPKLLGQHAETTSNDALVKAEFRGDDKGQWTGWVSFKSDWLNSFNCNGLLQGHFSPRAVSDPDFKSEIEKIDRFKKLKIFLKTTKYQLWEIN